MGSITKPVTPQITNTVIQPQTATSQTSSVEEKTDTIETTEEEQQSSSRKDSLLRRSRGRSGTIFTSLSGFLSPNQNANDSSRKTLLGE